MKNYPLGFDKEQKLIVSLDTQSVNPDHFESIKSEFLSNPHITGATVSSSVPGRWMYFWRTFPSGQEVEKNLAMNFFQFDYDFLPEYDIEFIAGRPFDKEITTDNHAYIINQAAAHAYGWEPAESAVGKLIGRRSIPVIGVTDNFHFKGLQEEVAPVVMFLICEDYKYLSLTVDTENLGGTMKFVEQKQRELQPGKPLEYFFLDDDFNRQYNTEAQLSKLIGIFTLIAISIACLGIIGLASYMTENRTKEIGVRKVLGATVVDISVLISKQFIITVIIANIIAWPVTFYAADKWLQGLAYRTGIDVWVFILAAILSISLALITTSFQSLKAALANPVQSLRHE